MPKFCGKMSKISPPGARNILSTMPKGSGRVVEVMWSGRVGTDESSTCRSGGFDTSTALTSNFGRSPQIRLPGMALVCMSDVPDFVRFIRNFLFLCDFFSDLGRGSFTAAFCW